MCKTIFISVIVVLICLMPATSDEGAAKAPSSERGVCRLVSVEHSCRGLSEKLAFAFAPKKDASGAPEYEVLHLEFSSRLIITLKNTDTAAKRPDVVSPLVRGVEIKRIGANTEIHIQTRRDIVYSVRTDPPNADGALVVTLADPAKSRYWLRIDSLDFSSPPATGRLRSALLRRDIAAFPVKIADGKYFVACEESWPDATAAEKKKAELCEVLDEIIAADPRLPFAAAVSVEYGLGADGAKELRLPRNPKIEALVRALEKDPADYKASLESKLLSDTCREILKHGVAAIPSLVRGAYDENDNVRRSCIFMILFDEKRISATAPNVRISVMIDAMAEKDATLRTEALLRLTYLELVPALLPAITAALDDKEAWVRFFAAQKLAQNGAARGVPGLIDCIAVDETCSRAGEVLCAVTRKRFNPGGPGACPSEKRPGLVKEWKYWWKQTGRFVALPLEPQLYESAQKTIEDFVLGVSGDSAEGPRNAQFTRRGGFVFGRRSDKLAVLGLFDGIYPPNADGEPALRFQTEIAIESPPDTPSESALWVFDIDGDGVDEVMVVFGGASTQTVAGSGKVKPVKNTVETLTCVIWRVDEKAKKFVGIYRHTIYRKTVKDAGGLFAVHKTERLLFDFEKTPNGPPLMVVTRLLISGDGANARTERNVVKLEPENSVYKMRTIEKPPATKPQPANKADSQAATPLGTVHKIVVVKSQGVLIAYDKEGKEMKRYDVITGAVKGDKEIEGDKKTPEGEFYICVKNTASKYHLSLGMSYPNAEDAQRGLKAKRISQEEHDAIVAAIKKGGIPPWKTKLGGEIFIHGEKGDRADTRGCIAMSNADIEELFAKTALGVKVVVKP